MDTLLFCCLTLSGGQDYLPPLGDSEWAERFKQRVAEVVQAQRELEEDFVGFRKNVKQLQKRFEDKRRRKTPEPAKVLKNILEMEAKLKLTERLAALRKKTDSFARLNLGEIDDLGREAKILSQLFGSLADIFAAEDLEGRPERISIELLNHTNQMLEWQKEVLRQTKQTVADIQANPAQLPTDVNRWDAFRIANCERDVIGEATKALAYLELKGAPVQFKKRFEIMHRDLDAVRGLLELCQCAATLASQEKIIASLLELADSLDKHKSGYRLDENERAYLQLRDQMFRISGDQLQVWLTVRCLP